MSSTASLDGTLPLIVQLLLEKGQLKKKDVETIKEAQLKEHLPVEEILIKKHLAGERDIAMAYADYFLMPIFEPDETGTDLDSTLVDQLPEKLCRDHLIAPVAVNDRTLDVAFFTPNELHIIDELQLLTGLEINPLIAPLSMVEILLGTLYSNSSTFYAASSSSSTDFEEMDEDEEDGEDVDAEDDEVVHLDQPPPPGRDGRIIRYVNQMLEQACRVGASDIHIEPYEDHCRVRLRIDGSLNEIAPPAQSLFVAVVSRLKVLAKLDIAEKRMPQDGAIALKTEGKRIDMRVSTVPTIYGEKVVLRVLDKGAIPLELSGLGLDERQSKDLAESIEMPHGLMLVTGPTGSGKSTTLYTCLNRLNKPGTNICTAEDPVEYTFGGINQIQVKAQIGFTFASALRSFLRQDPDVIMVGEVRDSETAQICLRAALTGHFVLSTLHTNDALAAVSRLEDMDVEPFLLASTLRVLVAQRLVRRLCPKCREQYECDPETAKRFGLTAGETLHRPKGCKNCRDKGYRGRVGIFEVIRITSRMAELIQKRASHAELRRTAVEEGMKLLDAAAMEKARQGVTSLEEAASITISEEE